MANLILDHRCHGPHVFDLAGINWIGNLDRGKVTRFKLPLNPCLDCVGPSLLSKLSSLFCPAE